jgi:anti-sigma regulatory factor (Ser/Thr protein kinase)
VSTLRIPASADRFYEVCEFVRSRAAALGVPDSLHMKLDLVVEELVVNIASYAYPDGGGDVEVECEREFDPLDEGASGEFFCVRLRDWGLAFDPLQGPPPDVTAAMHKRDVGGLGVHLVREMTDSCRYERRQDMNEFTACFQIG